MSHFSKPICLISFFVASFIILGKVSAEPPEIVDNPGIPGLLAEIARLETELAETLSELEATRNELIETQRALETTQSQLASTRAELQLTQEDLNVTTALLDKTKNELEVEKLTFRIPKTGQNDCWDALSLDPDDPHFTFPCAQTGQDGDHQAGIAPPTDRFVDNDNGTVTDTFTNLVWLIRGDCANNLSWPESIELANSLNGMPNMNLCSLRDGSAPGIWRLPNLREMTSLLNYDTPISALPDDIPFIGFSETYWTSTTYALRPSYPVSNVLWFVCGTRGYGLDNRERYNEAYVVNMRTGEVRHSPKEKSESIMRKHKQGKRDFALDTCIDSGFTNGAPDTTPPQPKFIAVRNLTVDESQK